jgi:FO synthase
VIVQNFTPRPSIVMEAHEEADDLEMRHAVALARLILPREISLQAPPNLNPRRTAMLIASGINDWGGISPVTPDYINPRHPWPHLAQLMAACARDGFALRPRLPIYPRFVDEPGWLDDGLRAPLQRAALRMTQGFRFDAPQADELRAM